MQAFKMWYLQCSDWKYSRNKIIKSNLVPKKCLNANALNAVRGHMALQKHSNFVSEWKWHHENPQTMVKLLVLWAVHLVSCLIKGSFTRIIFYQRIHTNYQFGALHLIPYTQQLQPVSEAKKKEGTAPLSLSPRPFSFPNTVFFLAVQCIRQPSVNISVNFVLNLILTKPCM